MWQKEAIAKKVVKSVANATERRQSGNTDGKIPQI
jgi:hypothetical protein